VNPTRAVNHRPPAWAVLETALRHRRPVQARYHGEQRVLCPHALGWTNGRAKVLCYQTGGATTGGPLPQDPTQRWRTLFVDQIHDPIITTGTWQTADNYTHHSTGIDQVELAVNTGENLK
jgi:hypothetical protein